MSLVLLLNKFTPTQGLAKSGSGAISGGGRGIMVGSKQTSGSGSISGGYAGHSLLTTYGIWWREGREFLNFFASLSEASSASQDLRLKTTRGGGDFTLDVVSLPPLPQPN